VTEIGNSPIQATGASAGTRQATNFKVVVVIDGDVPDVRPGFTCTADITTAVRDHAVSIPIPAVAVRELVYDQSGAVVQPKKERRRRRSVEPVASAAELEEGQTRKETEGAFVVRDGRVTFVPIGVGIAGEQYFEVLEGLKSGDEVITGPYNSVRGLSDGDAVRVENDRSR
jgi:HlyD family secretion protein